MSKKYYLKISNMSLNELKTEYNSCVNQEKKNMIKHVAKHKKQQTKQNKEKSIEQNINTIIAHKNKKNNEQETKKLIMKRGHMEKYWESNQAETSNMESHYRTEIERDYTNNKLMERLNSELDSKINEPKKAHTILKPYDTQDDDSCEDSYESEVPINNFSSKRLIH